MPIRIEFRHDGGMVMWGSGVVSFRDLQASNEIIYHSSQRVRRTVYQIVDLLGAERVDLSEEEVAELAREDVDGVGNHCDMLIAVIHAGVLPDPLAKLWQSRLQGSRVLTGIFNDRAAAEAWVRAQGKAPEAR